MAQQVRRTAVQARGRSGYAGFSIFARNAIFDAAKSRDDCKVLGDHDIRVQLEQASLHLEISRLEGPIADYQIRRYFALPVEVRDVKRVSALVSDAFPELDHQLLLAKNAAKVRVIVSTPYAYLGFMSTPVHSEPKLDAIVSEARSLEEALRVARLSENALQALVLLENAPHTPELGDLRREAIALVRSNPAISSGMDLLEQDKGCYFSGASDGLLARVTAALSK